MPGTVQNVFMYTKLFNTRKILFAFYGEGDGGTEELVYCHPDYLTYMWSTSCKMVDWMAHKLESRLLEEISKTLDMQVIPP